MTKQELEDKIDELHDKINEAFNKPDMSWEWYRNLPWHKEAAMLEREYKLLLEGDDIEYTPIDGIGDKMTLEKFIDCCKCGGFIDSDGFGYYATKDKETNITIHPSDIMCGKYRKDFNYIIWYNR